MPKLIKRVPKKLTNCLNAKRKKFFSERKNSLGTDSNKYRDSTSETFQLGLN